MKFFLLFIIITGCAQRIKTPVNRGISPEAKGEGYSAKIASTTVIESKLQVDESIDLDDELSSKTMRETAFQFNFALARQFEIYTCLVDGVAPILGLKVQFWGLPKSSNSVGHKISLTIAAGNASDSYKDDLEVEIDSKIRDYSVIHGYRFSESILIYESFSISEYRFKGKIKNPIITFTRDRFQFNSSNVQTLALGLIATYGILDFDLEGAYQKYRFNDSDYESVFGLQFGASAKF